MKIESIHIQHFGHFVNFDLPFGEHPFVLLFGQNEAGKTTLLEYLRQLLFGFPERTPYNFGEGGELSGSARLILADRRPVELKRRKGRKNTVQARLNGQDTELDDAGFRQLLGNANENVFKTVFAFGLDELRTGNEGLQEESLQSALFGGGLGGAFNPESLLRELEAEAGGLFRPSASKYSINMLSAELRRLAAEIKHKSIRPADYEQREQSWKEAQAEADRLADELTELLRQHARTQRLADALPRRLKLQALRVERQTLVVPSVFPRDAEHQFTTACDTIRRLTREVAILQEESAAAQEQLGTLQLDRTLLPLRAEIEDCQRMIQSVTDARRDLPLRREERERLHEEITSEVSRLRPGWSLDDLRSYSVDAKTSHLFDDLYRRRAELNEHRTKLETRQTEGHTAIQQISVDLEVLGDARDVSAWSAVLELSAEYVVDQKGLKKEQEEQAKLLRTLDSQKARLSPPLNTGSLPSSTAIQQLPVPPRELANRFNDELRDLQQRMAAARQSLAECENSREQMQRELSTLERQRQVVPSLDDLQQQRADRDELWRRLRARHIDQQADNAPAPSPDRYEQSVRDTDQTANRIYEHADQVARREYVVRQLAELSTTLHRREEDCQKLEREQQDLELRWAEVWRPCGFSPLAPDLMLSWLDAFEAFAQTRDAVGHRQVELDSYRDRLAAFESRLREVMQDREGDIKTLLAAAKLQLKNAEDDAQQRKRQGRDKKRLENQLREIDSELQAWRGAEAKWLTEWQHVMKQIGLPVDWNATLAHDVRGKLAAAREKSSNLTALERRISQMEGRLADFDPRVRRICEQLGQKMDSDRPEVTAETLQQRLTEASQLQERRANLEDRLTANRNRVREQTAELHEWQTKRQELLNRAAAADDQEFLAVAGRARRAADLDAQMQELSGQLAVARGHEAEDAFHAELDRTDAVMLQADRADLDARLKSQKLAAEQAREKAGSLRCQFEELDGSNAAALLQEQMAQQQAKLTSEIHRYVPLVFARHLLQDAIKRFERENQPQMIRGISRLLSTMTRGRYVEIERPTSDHAALYVRANDGTEFLPEQMSTGPREQLYLAIRLGYVLHYCQQAEPLPIVMDDVLVNFDHDRALATLEALREASGHAQILFFTCHQHIVDLVTHIFPEIQPRELPARVR